ncbi:tyrosine-type recombinase/integrase [Tabrizicola sp. BL-A-41-H6]|uniref:tyrosine-type recombinase/integrase n=1 Tax=Tabrizicola sp. BL-A-41-H6 TaxID=3421107 RepID=UPI003D67ABA5
MVQVNIKGIHRVTKTLANGALVQYHYAWRGGPKFWRSDSKIALEGPDYFAAYKTALEHRNPSQGLFREIIIAYLASPEFNRLKPRTQSDIRTSVYHRQGIDAQFGTAPIGVFERSEIRRIAYTWRDKFKPRQADHFMSHLSAIIAWAFERGWLKTHQLQNWTHLYSVDRSEIIWTEDEINLFCKVAPPYVARILIAATESGLRPGDLVRLNRGHISTTPKGRRIVLRTGKRNRIVSVPVTPRMGELIDATPKGQMLLLVNEAGQKWATQNSLGKTVSKWRDKAGIRPELRLYDARGTAATRLFHADASLREIGMAMGWSPTHTARMIEVYAHMNPGISDSTLLKLQRAD